ncbi:hypothetical protein F8M41_017383 [Gigaspora margarita]|uniref:RING-type domain-containing protein n=1 Tax=Gigaspora margarita TaxID=4874 RepID=A0A8H4AN35_GIGMA|nr:hypothetical protein F8M41_017383 [Gigaspora margarita]
MAKGEHRFHLAGLNIVANKKQIPLGFSSNCIPAKDECDFCGTLLNIPSLNPIILACGHGYHEACFNTFSQKCSYCQSFLEKEESKRRKKSKNAETEDLSLEDNILAQLEKDKSALNRVEEACKIAIDRFLNV